MKKLLVLALVLVLCLSIFAACGNKDNGSVALGPESGLDDAVAYLAGMADGAVPESTTNSFSLASSVTLIGLGTYSVEWSVDNDKVTVAKAENGQWDVTLPARENAAINYTLTAVVTAANGASRTITLSRVIPKLPIFNIVTNFEEGVAYNLVLERTANPIGSYFWNGSMDGYYLATTQNAQEAVNVYIENVEGGYYIYAMLDGVKTYIDIYEYTNSKGALAGSLKMSTTVPEIPFSFNADAKTSQITIGDNTYYMGTYSSYTTVSVSNVSFISGDNASNVDKSQFPLRICTLRELTDEDKVEQALIALSLPASYSSDGSLPATGLYGTSLSWEVENDATALVVGDDGHTFTLNRGLEDVNVGLKVTATLNNESKSKDYVVKVAKLTKTNFTVAELVDYMSSYSNGEVSTIDFTVTGVVISSSYNSQFSSYNANLAVPEGAEYEVQIYSAKMDESIEGDYTAADALVGCTVTVTGRLKLYVKNGTSIYEVAYDKSHGLSPVITSVVAAGEGPEGAITVSKTVAEIITLNKWDGIGDNKTKHLEAKLDDVVTVTVAGGSNSGKCWADNWRIYATDTPAGTVTISLAEGYTLVSVKIITEVTTEEATYAFLQVGDVEDASNKTVGVSGSSVTFNTVKNGSNGKQVRILAIEVVYVANDAE